MGHQEVTIFFFNSERVCVREREGKGRFFFQVIVAIRAAIGTVIVHSRSGRGESGSTWG